MFSMASDGAPLAQPGFDAIVGNPPWEMLRGDAGDAHTRERKADDGSRLTKFARGSGIYRLQGGGHANLYQMFVERTLSLVRRDGRLGLILPSGFASDHGCASLRRHVLDQTAVDSFVVVENREGLFPIHRAVKFVLMTLTKSQRLGRARWTERVAAALRDPVSRPVRRAARDRRGSCMRCAYRAS